MSKEAFEKLAVELAKTHMDLLTKTRALAGILDNLDELIEGMSDEIPANKSTPRKGARLNYRNYRQRNKSKPRD